MNARLRIEYDSTRGLVNLMLGNECVDQMSLQVFAAETSVEAALELSRPAGTPIATEDDGA